MKLTIKTSKLQEMVSRAIKGCPNNKMIPLTSLMCVELKDGTLTLSTTDATNYLYIKDSSIEGEDFYVTILADTFAKLIARLTCETVSLELKERTLEVKGNGTYKLELPLDENGELIKFPNPAIDSEPAYSKSLDSFKQILTANKAALAVNLDVPCYANYYVGDSVISTDTYKMCRTDVDILDKPMLISAELMNLLDVMTADTIEITIKDNKIRFDSEDCIIYGVASEGIEDYAVDSISGLLEQSFPSMCKVSKDAMLSVLDRLALFVGTYDKNALNLTFTQEGIMISSKQSTGTELIKYTELKDFAPFTGQIDIVMLQSQIKAQRGSVITIEFGVEGLIKMVDDNVTQIVALMEE